MKDSQHGDVLTDSPGKYIKANNERFSTDFPLLRTGA